MVMTQIPVSQAQEIASKAGLKPAKVKGTEVLQFTRRGGKKFDLLDWTDFETALDERGLRVYEYGGFLKIMK